MLWYWEKHSDGTSSLCKAAEYYRQHLSPGGVWLGKTIMLNRQRLPSPGASRDAAGVRPLHFGSHHQKKNAFLFLCNATWKKQRDLVLPWDPSNCLLSAWYSCLNHGTTELGVSFLWQSYNPDSHSPRAGVQLGSPQNPGLLPSSVHFTCKFSVANTKNTCV